MPSYVIMDGATEFARGDGNLIAPDGMVAVQVPFPAKDWDVVPDGDDYAIVPRTTPIEELRAQRWALVKAARDKAELSGCMTPLGRVDTDADAQRKIAGAVQMAMIGSEAFSIEWTMQDNNVVVHDAPAMIAMGVAVGSHVAACHAEGVARREMIEAAEDQAALDAVPVETGWP